MTTRLDNFYSNKMDLILDNADFYCDPWWESRQILASGLDNGSIEKPDWLMLSVYTDYTKLQDELEPDYAIIIHHGERS